MTIYAQDFITSMYERMGLPMPTIEAVEDQPNRYRLLPDVPYSSEDMAVITRNFGDVAPTEFGVVVGISDTYPPKPAAAPTPAERAWLTPENTLQRRLEVVLIEHHLIDNVKAITDIVGSYVVKFNGATPAVPAGSKRADLAQAGLLEIKTGSPGTWTIRVSDMWRIEQQAGDLLRQREAEIRDLKARLSAALDEARDAQDSEAVTLAKLETARAQRDDLRRERDQLEAQITTPQPMPKWAPLRGEIGYTMPRGCKLHIATSLAILNDLMGQGGKLIGQPEIHSATELYALVEMRDGVPARLPNYAGQVTIVNRTRPLMSRAARIAADNADVIEAIRTTPRTPVQPITPLEVSQ